jgi:hypothetical protein
MGALSFEALTVIDLLELVLFGADQVDDLVKLGGEKV